MRSPETKKTMKPFLMICLLIVLFDAGILTSYGFAQQPLVLSGSKKATPQHIEALKSHGLTSIQIDDFQRLISSASGEVEVSFDKKQRIPDFVKAELSLPVEITKPEEQGYYYFEQFKNLYRIKDVRKELRPAKTKQGRLNNRNIRFQQYYKDIKVEGAELMVHVKSDSKLWFVQGKHVPDINISIEPGIQGVSVIKKIQNDFVSRQGSNIEFTISPPELGVLNPWVYDRTLESKNVLIWVAIAKEILSGREWTYYVDAQNGQILNVMDSVRDIDSEIRDRRNTTSFADDELWYVDNVLQTIQGKTVRQETTDLNTFFTQYWNYLLTTFGIYSINSATSPDGMQLIGDAYYVTASEEDNDPSTNWCPNAAWNGSRAVFCQGMVTRDIVSHELTHALVEISGGDLVYRNQPGALNESFADVFGEFVDCRAGNCTWSGSRDLSNPLNSSRQQPDHIGNTGNSLTDHPLYHLPCNPSQPSGCTPNNDYGGVHHNSGIPNIVAYLIINGTLPYDPHYNFQIKGIGLSKAEWLYYSTIIDTGLTSTAEFSDARNVMVNVCEDFFYDNKRHGFTANDCCQVKNAWASVGVGNACSAMGGSFVSGALSTESSPYFITDDITIAPGQTLTVNPNVDVYFFPNTSITAYGRLDADGTSGNIRFLKSSDNDGTRISSKFRLQNGGQYKMPEATFISTDTYPSGINFNNQTINNQLGIRSYIYVDSDIAIRDVNFGLFINYSRDSDLSLMLQSPGGTSVLLFSGVGGDGDHFINTTLDDEADTAISAGTAPFTGSFRPQNDLSAFDGQNSRGYWQLTVGHNNAQGTRSLVWWSLTFEK